MALKLVTYFFGWGSWIRTNVCWIQRPEPYRLAIPQCTPIALVGTVIKNLSKV